MISDNIEKTSKLHKKKRNYTEKKSGALLKKINENSLNKYEIEPPPDWT